MAEHPVVEEMGSKALPRVLLVEDDDVTAALVEEILVSSGFRVEARVATGEDALSCLETATPDLVLMDISLAGAIDGIETAQRMSSSLEAPVVFLSGKDDAKTLDRAKLTGPFGYVMKPLQERDFLLTCELALHRYREQNRLRESERFLSDLFDAIPSSLVVVDDKLMVSLANREYGVLVGALPEKIVGYPLGTSLRCAGPDQSRRECGVGKTCQDCDILQAARLAIGGGSVHRKRCEIYLSGNGERRHKVALLSAAPLANRDRQLAVVVFEDITELNRLRRLLKAESSFAGIVGVSTTMQDVFETIREVAPVDAPVLIQGESGTGKEMVARAIHNEGPRAKAEFVPVNCGALPEGLIESELFGHVKGSFTGAHRDRKGRFELASGGTIFLDEVAELSPAMQVKLLRVLQEGTFEAVGGESTRTTDARVISATNRDLRAEVKARRFREDLFYRLCVVPIELPPIRERLGDIPLLAGYLLEKAAAVTDGRLVELSPGALEALAEHSWPGNVRELQNALQYARIKAKGGFIEMEHLPIQVRRKASAPSLAVRSRRRLSSAAVLRALEKTGGNRSEAAKILGVSRATLYRFFDEMQSSS